MSTQRIPDEMTPDRSGFLTSDGHTRPVYREYFGDGQRDVVVLFNGFATTTHFWHMRLPYLRPQFDVLLFDCYGQGRSCREDEPCRIAELADRLVSLMDQQGIDRIHGVGTSYGAYLGMVFGGLYPARLQTLTVSGIAIRSSAPWSAYLDTMIRFCGGTDVEFALFPHFLFGTVWGRAHFTRTYGERGERFAEHCHHFYQSHRGGQRHLFRILEGLRETYDSAFAWERVTAPTLVLTGVEDWVVPPSDQAHIVSVLPDARQVLLDDCGHAPSIEQPVAYWSEIVRFIAANQHHGLDVDGGARLMRVSSAGHLATDRRADLTCAVDRALSFLEARQLPSGQFPIEATQPAKQITEPDASIFATTHIVYSLGFVPGPSASRMIASALDYFLAEMRRSGLWRYWNKDAVWAGRRVDPFIPADLDDTASVSFLLARHGVTFPENQTLFVLNRNRAGLFYTWLMMRPTATLNPRYWWTMVRELTLQRLTLFWKVTEAGYRDVDGVVNANILLYLGDRPETAAAIDWLKSIVRTGREADCDKWYRDAFSFWYALSRTYHAGVHAVGDVRSGVVAKVEDAADPTGRIGEHPLHTAAAMNTLLNFGGGENTDVLARAAAYLLETQADDGSWPSAPYYYGGPLKAVSWGSRELTTGLCLEALARCAAIAASGLPLQ